MLYHLNKAHPLIKSYGFEEIKQNKELFTMFINDVEGIYHYNDIYIYEKNCIKSYIDDDDLYEMITDRAALTIRHYFDVFGHL
jgi:hypothetical protein